MPDPVTALIVGGTSVIGGAMQSSAAKSAGAAQERAAMMGVEEQRAAREEMRKLLEPYVAAGTPALQQQMAALGLAGPESQAEFVKQQEQSPIFQALARQQEEAILQNASATGGLRGGNVQGALAQFRPALLNQFLTQQYERLGGMTALGQRSAAGVGAAGQETAGAIGNLLGEMGAAQAGAKLGSAQAWGNVLSLPAQFAGIAYGAGKPGFGKMF
jgi:hypothetical protein